MAQARRKKNRNWLKRFLLFVFVPFFVWFLAFLIWFNWSAVEKLIGTAKPPTKASGRAVLQGERSEKTEQSDAPERPSKPPEPALEARPKEKILDEDRKKLEDILKKQ